MNNEFKMIVNNVYSRIIADKPIIPFNSLPSVDSRVSCYLAGQSSQGPVKDRAEILREYEGEKWGKLLSRLIEKQDFSHTASMNEFYGQGAISLLFRGKVYEAAVLDYQLAVSSIMADFIKFLASDKPVSLLELGCGFGGTLVAVANKLSHTSRLSSVIGYDISISGLEILTRVARVEGITVNAVNYDFSSDDPVPSSLAKEESVCIAFTHFSLAAVSDFSSNPISKIFKTSEAKYLIIFEPVALSKEQLTFSAYITDMHIRSNHYNANIRDYVDESIKEGHCRLLVNFPDIIGSSIASAVSIYVLERAS